MRCTFDVGFGRKGRGARVNVRIGRTCALLGLDGISVRLGRPGLTRSHYDSVRRLTMERLCLLPHLSAPSFSRRMSR